MLILLHISACFLRCALSWFTAPWQTSFNFSSFTVLSSHPPHIWILRSQVRRSFGYFSASWSFLTPTLQSLTDRQAVPLLTSFDWYCLVPCFSELAPAVPPPPATFSTLFYKQAASHSCQVSIILWVNLLFHQNSKWWHIHSLSVFPSTYNLPFWKREINNPPIP